ncbi:MAG: hypothetical protein NXI31_18905 [bacterium]|nr:hypothetical protein [bacterium]
MIKVQTLRSNGFLALLALAACSGSPAHFGGLTATGPNSNREATALTEPAGNATADTNTTATPAAPTPAAQDPQGQESRAMVLARKAVENARRSLDLRLFEDARNEAAFALELDNNNKEARDILRRCNSILGDGGAGISLGGRLEESIIMERVRLERERALVENELQLGKALMETKAYGRAIDRFERAVTAMRYSAFAQANDGLKKEAERMLAEAQEAKRMADAAELEAQEAQSASDLARQEAEARAARELTVQRILDQANLEFQAGQYARSLEYVDEALLRDPTNPTAMALRDLADRARHATAMETARERWRTEWNKTFLELQHANLPQTESVVFDPTRWATVSQRSSASYTKPNETETPENQAILRILEETALEHNFSSATVDDWASYYASLTRVTFFVTQEVRDMPAEQTTLEDFRLPNRSVASALQAIQAQTNVAFRVRDGMVHLVSPENAIGMLYLKPYMVSDLIQGVQSSPGPDLRLPVPGDDLPLFPEVDEDPLPSVVDEGRLQELLTATVAPEKWDGSPFTMNLLSGILYVRADSETHQEVDRLLGELRRHVGIQVDVESRFLKVEDQFLEDLGIDLRGLGNQASQGLAGRGLEKQGPRTNAGFDDFGPRQQQNSATPGLVGTGTEPGIFIDDGLDGDIMARTEGLYDSTLGGRNGGLENSGGLALQYAFLDDTEVEIVLRAVAKQERSEEIEAPRLLIYNNSRASMHHLRNISYIRDFEVEIAQAAAVANPVIGTVHDGVALDVRPVVDADLRFITMELRPTVMSLQLPIPTFTTTLGVGQPISIQLPEVTLQRVRTTVTMPDGGTMMLGGMRLVERQNLRSTVPLLGSLPGLSWLFSRQGKSVQNRKILILIRARIILMEEHEPRAVTTPSGEVMMTGAR